MPSRYYNKLKIVRTILGKEWVSITEPGTKVELRTHYNQIKKYDEVIWFENKNGSYEVAIPKKEFDRIEKKSRVNKEDSDNA